MASSRLFKDARAEFVRECESRYTDSKDMEMLRDFLSSQGSPEEAQQAAHSLKADAGKKWGSKKVGDTEIPSEWIDKIMGNISNFVEVGNYAMQGAPESVGLAWFAVKLTLSAIQSNYALYSLFGSGLTDISEIMIIIPHYDRLYDERNRAKGEWKQSPIVDKLFKNIVSAYAAVLNFSFSVRRHLSAGTLARVRHGFKDFFGASEAKFRGKLDHIASLKKKIVEDSQAIFQDKTLHQLESVKGIVSNIEGAVKQVQDFQQTLQRMHEEQADQWQTVLKRMEEMKASTKPITTWDQALLVFEKNRNALNPQKDTGDALGTAIDQRNPDT
jgi:methyl-accepting chemotaxis protein